MPGRIETSERFGISVGEEMICRCTVEINGLEVYAELLAIRQGRATVKVDGYSATDTVDANQIKDTWT